MTENQGTPERRDDRSQGDGGANRRSSGPGRGGGASGRGGFRSGHPGRGGRKNDGSRDSNSRSSGAGRPGDRARSGPRRPGDDRDRGRSSNSASRGSERAGNRDSDATERDPQLPEGIDLADLPRGMKAELKGLPPEMADKVGLRLIAAGRLLEVDPNAAYAQAKVARRLAARLPVVRAAVAETAYAAGDYQAALTDYRALRRMTGDEAYLPVMADCERALGRPEEALKLAREAGEAGLDPASAIELRMVEAGARADLGQEAEALRLLKREIEASQRIRGLNDTSKARLRYAYADHLLSQGERESAREWFAAAARLDRDAMTDADERVAELDGLVIEFDDSEDEENPEDREDTDVR